ncbi:MAG: fibronectin type III domain-containing protein [Thermoplasmatota archaeon]
MRFGKNGTVLIIISLMILLDGVQILSPIFPGVSNSGARGAPSPPENVSASLVSRDVIEVSWDPPSSDGGIPIISYDLLRSMDGGIYIPITSSNSTSGRQSYWDADLEPDHNFSYRVSASNQNGSSPLSEEAWIILEAPPNSPNNLTAISGDGKVYLQWEEPEPRIYSGIDGYSIALYFEGEWIEPSMTKPSNATSWEITGLENAGDYYAELVAFNSIGGSEPAGVSFSPGAPPSPPTNVRIAAEGSSAVISWNTPGNNGGYPVVRYHVFRKVNNGSIEVVGTRPSGARSLTDHGLELDTRYHYYIRAENIIGFSLPSEVVEFFKPTTYNVPLPPNITLARKGVLWIEIHWEAPPAQAGAPITEYRVYRTHFDKGRFENTTTVGPNSTLFNDTDVKYDINYTYRISAVNRIGESGKGDPVTIRVRNLSEPSPEVNITGKVKKDHRALIFGAIGGLVIVAISIFLYFFMTREIQIEPPPGDGESYEDNLTVRIDRGQGPS